MSSIGNTLGGGVAGLLGSQATASAQGQLGMAQLGQQQGDRAYLMPTQQEQDQLKQALDVNNQSISQSQKLLASADPALIETGRQALDLMQGKSAAALAPIQNQRAQQRQQLMQQLQTQLGPGAANSSAGIQALNNFDQQTSNLMAGAQQNTLNSFLGYTSGARSMGQAQQQQGITNLENLTNQSQGMRINAVRGASVNGGLAQMGNLANAQANQAGMGSLIGMGAAAFGGGGVGSLGSLFGGSGGGGGAGSPPPTTPGYGPGQTSYLGNYDLSGAGINKFSGGKVPGMALMAGDHPANDTVNIKASPGEGILKRTDMASREAAHAAVDRMFDAEEKPKGVSKGKKNYDDGTVPVNPLGATSLSAGIAANGGDTTGPSPADRIAGAFTNAFSPTQLTPRPTGKVNRVNEEIMEDKSPAPSKEELENTMLDHEIAMQKARQDPRFAQAVAAAQAKARKASSTAGDANYYSGGKVKPDPKNPRNVIDHHKSLRKKYA